MDHMSDTTPTLASNDEFTEEELREYLEFDPERKYAPIEFKDSIQMMLAVMPDLRDKVRNLYNWQVETNTFLCTNVFDISHPLQFVLCACNGSGKDAFVIAPFAVWHCVSKIRSRVIITSSSFNQLKNQTEPSIRAIANAINTFTGEKTLIVKHFHIVCKATGSEILMFSTDDPGLAEGYHPFPDYKGAEMAIIINESKTVKDEIFAALRRCNGYNRWIEVSSPGKTSGHMYNMYRKSTVYPNKYKLRNTTWYARKVTAYDCPHISKVIIEDDKREFGEHSPQFRSMYLAEFTSLDEAVVIPIEMLQKSCDKGCIETKSSRGVSAGIDLSFSLGGDESVGYCIRNNLIVDSFSTRISDTVQLKDYVASKIREWKLLYGLLPENTFIDDGNAGKSVIDMLRNMDKLEVSRVINQSSAVSKLHYANKGAELYWNVRRLVEESLIYIDAAKYAKLYHQLTSRRYKQHAINGKLVLESKTDSRAKGLGSPDHADAYVLAFTGLTINDFVDINKTEAPAKRVITQEDILSGNVNVEEILRPRKQTTNLRHYNSLHNVLRNYRKEIDYVA